MFQISLFNVEEDQEVGPQHRHMLWQDFENLIVCLAWKGPTEKGKCASFQRKTTICPFGHTFYSQYLHGKMSHWHISFPKLRSQSCLTTSTFGHDYSFAGISCKLICVTSLRRQKHGHYSWRDNSGVFTVPTVSHIIKYFLDVNRLQLFWYSIPWKPPIVDATPKWHDEKLLGSEAATDPGDVVSIQHARVVAVKNKLVMSISPGALKQSGIWAERASARTTSAGDEILTESLDVHSGSSPWVTLCASHEGPNNLFPSRRFVAQDKNWQEHSVQPHLMASSCVWFLLCKVIAKPPRNLCFMSWCLSNSKWELNVKRCCVAGLKEAEPPAAQSDHWAAPFGPCHHPSRYLREMYWLHWSEHTLFLCGVSEGPLAGSKDQANQIA